MSPLQAWSLDLQSSLLRPSESQRLRRGRRYYTCFRDGSGDSCVFSIPGALNFTAIANGFRPMWTPR